MNLILLHSSTASLAVFSWCLLFTFHKPVNVNVHPAASVAVFSCYESGAVIGGGLAM